MFKEIKLKSCMKKSLTGLRMTIVLITLISSVVFAQEFSISNNTTFSLGSSTLILPVNLVNNGTFNSDNGTIVFNGSNENQIVSGNFSFNDIKINKSSGSVQLLNDIYVNGNLEIISGDINGNDKVVTLGSNAVLTETPGNTFGGGIITTTKTLDAPNQLNILGAIITSSANLGTTVITRGHTASGQTNQSIRRYYDISPVNNNTLNATLIFNYDESELNGLPEEELILFGSTDSGTNWEEIGGVINQQLNYLTIIGVNQFSRLTLGSSSSPLPVELISFAAVVDGNSVKLTWHTATEILNYGFEIERLNQSRTESPSGWENIGFVQGFGNSASSKFYEFIDNNPVGGTNFKYRLKQIDNDGSYKYSNEVEINLTPAEFYLAQNYPNPFNPSTTISYSLPSENNVSLILYNSLGEKLVVLVDEVKPAGKYDITFNASDLASGTYIYRLQAGSYVETKKMILMK